MSKGALAAGELESKVPESHQFYWGKIQRQIERAESGGTQPTSDWLGVWRRLLAPVAGVVLIAFLTVYSFKMYEGGEESRRHLAVVENLSEHTGAYSFRSQSEKMFVVWVYDRSEETEGEPEPTEEAIDQ